MLFGNVICGSILPMVTFILRIIPSTSGTGDDTVKVLRAIPNFTVSNSIIYDASKELFNNSRRARVAA